MGETKADERKIVLAAIAFAIAGIALLLFLSETPRSASVAEALVSEPNSLLIVSGTAANVTAAKFYLCDHVCISARGNGLPSAYLLTNGRAAIVTGRVQEYQGNVYFVAENIEVK